MGGTPHNHARPRILRLSSQGTGQMQSRRDKNHLMRQLDAKQDLSRDVLSCVSGEQEQDALEYHADSACS